MLSCPHCRAPCGKKRTRQLFVASGCPSPQKKTRCPRSEVSVLTSEVMCGLTGTNKKGQDGERHCDYAYRTLFRSPCLELATRVPAFSGAVLYGSFAGLHALSGRKKQCGSAEHIGIGNARAAVSVFEICTRDGPATSSGQETQGAAQEVDGPELAAVDSAALLAELASLLVATSARWAMSSNMSLVDKVFAFS